MVNASELRAGQVATAEREREERQERGRRSSRESSE